MFYGYRKVHFFATEEVGARSVEFVCSGGKNVEQYNIMKRELTK